MPTSPRYGDALPRIGETVLGKSYEMELGGKGANQAAAAARLGAKVEFVGRVGRRRLRQARLAPPRRIRRVDEAHSTKDADAPDRASPSSGSMRRGETPLPWSPAPICASARRSSQRGLPLLAHAKVLMLQLEIPVATCLAAARAARERGVIVVLDPAPAPTAPLPEELYRPDRRDHAQRDRGRGFARLSSAHARRCTPRGARARREGNARGDRHLGRARRLCGGRRDRGERR